MNNGEKIAPGDVQLMSAGSGVTHSEYNPSRVEGVHFLQIWIMPDSSGGTPSYQQKNFPREEKEGKLRLIISKDGLENSLKIKQEAKVYAGLFDTQQSATLPLKDDRSYYIHLVKGQLTINDVVLEAGDALKIYSGNDSLYFHDGKEAEVLVFDLNPVVQHTL